MKYVGGGSPIPIPTYFVGGYGVGAPKVLAAASKDPANAGFKSDGLRVCDNLFWLRGSGKFSLFGTCSPFLLIFVASLDWLRCLCTFCSGGGCGHCILCMCVLVVFGFDCIDC